MRPCPECGTEIPDFSINCPHCLHDLLPPTDEKKLEGWEYSRFADSMLVIGSIAAAVAVLVSGVMFLMAVVLLFENFLFRDLWNVFVAALAVCLSLANLVVFLRVGNLNRNPSGGPG